MRQFSLCVPYFSPNQKVLLHIEMPSREAFDLLVQVMSPWSRRGFRSALERFNVSKKAAETRDELGQVLYTDTSAIKAAAKHVLTYTKRR
jgi:hypothetical protein